MATVLVTGATGYIGGRLVPELLAAGHHVRALARTPAKLAHAAWRQDVDVVEGDVTDPDSLDPALDGVEVAYYLVHSMGGTTAFDEADRRAAATFRDAATRAGVGLLVYLGGLGADDDPTLSRHLRSRHEVGRVLADGEVPVVELRAALIIGSGSASFEMLRYLVEVLPVMVTPRWVENRCQPIAVRDVLRHLVAEASRRPGRSEVREIGGPDVLTYRQMMATYAEVAGLRRRVVVAIPVLTPKLSSLWVGLVTPLPSSLARPLVESLVNEVVVTRPSDPLPGPAPLGFRRSIEVALDRAVELRVLTRWSDAALPGRSARPLPTDPEWAGGSVFMDEKEVRGGASPDALFTTVTGVGGDRGWHSPSLLWTVRGWIDALVGGVGMRRGRRHPDDLRLGDSLDFWRVEAIERPSLLRLRAEMRLPGEAWLEWQIDPAEEGSSLRQRAIFSPRGLAGRLYWYALLPFHGLIFQGMARAMMAQAEERTQSDETAPTPRGVTR